MIKSEIKTISGINKTTIYLFLEKFATERYFITSSYISK